MWDNVEPIAGFPAGATSDWSEAEQRELVHFLRDATAPDTQAKFLLTSRREEREWLGELPTRVPVPPMPMRERLQLAHALAGRRGVRPAALPNLRPLLRFTDGNPLTILVTVGQALREGINTKERLEAYVAKLHAGTRRRGGIRTWPPRWPTASTPPFRRRSGAPSAFCTCSRICRRRRAASDGRSR